MIVKTTVELNDINGKPIPESKDGPITTLRSVITTALLTPLRGDENLKGGHKAELFALAMRVHSEDECDLKSEDITKIKERIGTAFPPLVVGRAYEILDPPAKATA